MSESSGILYQDSSYCLSCWGNSKQRLPKVPLNHFIINESGKDTHDKKVSLKKYNNSRLKHSEYKLSINQNLPLDNYSKTARVYQNPYIEQKIGWSPIKITFGNEPRPVSHDIRYTYPYANVLQGSEQTHYTDEKPIKSVICKPESKMLSKTTKIQRILPTKSEELKKTKKNLPFQKFVSLSQLKESVCSYTQSCNQQERLEESQILMDYFHPTDNQLNGIEQYIKEKGITRTESFHREIYTSK